MIIATRQKESTGQQFYLEDNGSYFSICGPFPKQGEARIVLHVGNEKYVRKRWKEFCAREDRFQGFNAQGMPVYGL